MVRILSKRNTFRESLNLNMGTLISIFIMSAFQILALIFEKV